MAKKAKGKKATKKKTTKRKVGGQISTQK